jgi:hypothetical protein
MKLEDVEKLKKALKEYNGEPQTVSREDYIRAKTNVSVMTLENTEDCLLFFSSLNLLNTYVKQHKNEISYDFKQDVVSGFDSAITNKIKDVTYNYDAQEKVLVIDVAGLQFSFHNVLPSAKMDYVKNFGFALDQKFCHDKQWEGIRLQPCAEAVFKFASSLDGLSKETFVGNLKEVQDAQIKADKENATNAQQPEK